MWQWSNTCMGYADLMGRLSSKFRNQQLIWCQLQRQTIQAIPMLLMMRKLLKECLSLRLYMLPMQHKKMGLLVTPSSEIEERYGISFNHSYILQMIVHKWRAPIIIVMVGRLCSPSMTVFWEQTTWITYRSRKRWRFRTWRTKEQGKNCNFERFVTVHKEKHIIIEGLPEHGYNGLDNRTKVKCMIDGVKME